MATGTRWKNGSCLRQYLGSGKELPTAELPTMRDVLRYGIFLRETSKLNRRNYSNSELIQDIYNKLLEKWQMASVLFVPPVTCLKHNLVTRLIDAWNKASLISQNKASKVIKQKFNFIIDKLFDLVACNCKIVLCSEQCCPPDCKFGAHITCICPRERKIPIIELVYIKAQREKIGSFSSYQLGPADLMESKRFKKVQSCKRRREEEKQTREKKHTTQEENNTQNEQDNEHDNYKEFESEENEIFSIQKSCTKYLKKSRNYEDISNIALASTRYGVGLRATAVLATAAWVDGGLVSQSDTRLIIDHSKVRRARDKVMNEVAIQFDDYCNKEIIDCIFFDGRKDLTKVFLTVDGSDRQYPAKVKEEHYTICSGDGKYLFHFTPAKEAKKNHAEIIADKINEYTAMRNINVHLKAIGGDSTNVNTGCDGGVMHFMELKLGRKLNWIVSALHTNELPLKRLIKLLDGESKSGKKWSGPFGSLLDEATNLEINPFFSKVETGEPLINLSNDVVKDLSTDQYYGYQIVNAIRSGHVPQQLGLLEIGPVNMARWLTTANRICRIWVSHHGLQGDAAQKLLKLVEFIVGVYFPVWFNIKVKHSWTEGPKHVLYQLKLLQHQSLDIQNTVIPTIKRSAWYAFSESILQTMLCSENKEERSFSVLKILEIRGEGDENEQLGDLSVRPRRTPDIILRQLVSRILLIGMKLLNHL
ncbi:uncharacterized protein LOC136085927 [Hydra vulgaris]|uniref:Uncharacterized protein LOC136085927 n=1 Tax=Hydra vulgaris TaxID=6087 RepID=A0ABM4CQ41_HYDVU